MSAQRRQDQHYEWGFPNEKAPKDMLRRVRCKTGHTIILLSERSRRKSSGLCKSERRTGNKTTSLEKILNTEACNPEAPLLIGRKSLNGWISDRDNPSESGDSGGSVSGNSASSRLGHLITSTP